MHDFEADLPGGLVAALEVTGVVEQERLHLAALAGRRLSGLRLPGSRHVWQVGLASDAIVNAIRPETMLGLLKDMEDQGRPNALNMGDYRDPFVAQLRVLGIESIYAFQAKPGREGIVMVGPGTYGGRGWGREAIDTWLARFLASDTGAGKLEKLGRAAGAAERHLVVVLGPFSQPGMGISLELSDLHEEGTAGDVIPSLVPPAPLTHLWLLPVMGSGEMLCWAHDAGWTVRELARDPEHASAPPAVASGALSSLCSRPCCGRQVPTMGRLRKLGAKRDRRFRRNPPVGRRWEAFR
jgi:hypothetical protein